MSNSLPNGTRFAVSTGLSAPAAITAISNGDPAEATSAAGVASIAEGDIIVLNSLWPELAESPARVGAIDGSTFELENIDTTDLMRFPPGEGTGTFSKVTGFLSLTQVLEANLSGGDQNYHEFAYVEDASSRQRRIPTFKSAMGYEFQLAYDPNMPWHQTLIELDRKRQMVVLRETSPSGETIYYTGYLAYNGVPTKELNVNQRVRLSFSINSDPIRYEA